MSTFFVTGAAIGLAAQKVRNRRKRAEILAQLQAQANSLQGRRIIMPPLATESWFSGHGAFTFALPQNFAHGDLSAWNGPRPSALAVDGSGASGMWLAVLQNQNRTLELDPGVSPWIAVVQPEAFREFAQRWGGTVVAGPEPILLGGEQAVWAVYSMIERGRANRKWVVFTSHRGHTFEVIMGVEPQTESMYVDAFWTAVGSWRWADQQHAIPTSGQEARPGLRSPDGKHWWDGAQWRAV